MTDNELTAWRKNLQIGDEVWFDKDANEILQHAMDTGTVGVVSAMISNVDKNRQYTINLTSDDRVMFANWWWPKELLYPTCQQTSGNIGEGSVCVECGLMNTYVSIPNYHCNLCRTRNKIIGGVG